VLVDDLVGVHVLVAGSEELNCEEEGLGFGKAAVAVAEHVHEGTAGAEFEGHIDVVVVLVLRGSELVLGLCGRPLRRLVSRMHVHVVRNEPFIESNGKNHGCNGPPKVLGR